MARIIEEVSKKQDDTTTIRVSRVFFEKIKAQKQYRRETYEEVFCRLLKWDYGKASGNLPPYR